MYATPKAVRFFLRVYSRVCPRAKDHHMNGLEADASAAPSPAPTIQRGRKAAAAARRHAHYRHANTKTPQQLWGPLAAPRLDVIMDLRGILSDLLIDMSTEMARRILRGSPCIPRVIKYKFDVAAMPENAMDTRWVCVCVIMISVSTMPDHPCKENASHNPYENV